MKKLQNTLYITSPDAYLHLDGETVVIRGEDKIIGQIPLHNLSGITCFGYKGVSPALMGKCAESGIELCFVSPHGKFLARVCGSTHGNVLLREAQILRAADCEKALEPACAFLRAKIYNSRWTLERTLRDHRMRVDEECIKNAIDSQKESLAKLDSAGDIGSLMGVEGIAAKAYFSAFNEMILRNKEEFRFTDRNRRPPTDRINALLSFTYTILTNEICGALESVGLDPYVGYLHQKRPGRCSLALDFLEEFRTPLADRFVLSQINLGAILPDDFEIKENGAVILKDDARRKFLTAWQTKKQEEIRHPFFEEKIPWGMAAYAQALLFARWLRGDIDAYPPFFWK